MRGYSTQQEMRRFLCFGLRFDEVNVFETFWHHDSIPVHLELGPSVVWRTSQIFKVREYRRLWALVDLQIYFRTPHGSIALTKDLSIVKLEILRSLRSLNNRGGLGEWRGIVFVHELGPRALRRDLIKAFLRERIEKVGFPSVRSSSLGKVLNALWFLREQPRSYLVLALSLIWILTDAPYIKSLCRINEVSKLLLEWVKLSQLWLRSVCFRQIFACLNRLILVLLLRHLSLDVYLIDIAWEHFLACPLSNCGVSKSR